jgi:hypothetical protein
MGAISPEAFKQFGQPRGRGAPVRMSVYHTGQAADLLIRRKFRSDREPLKASYSHVCEKWGITRTAAENALRKYRVPALEFLDTGSPRAVYRNIRMLAKAFRTLDEESDAIITAAKKMRGPRST